MKIEILIKTFFPVFVLLTILCSPLAAQEWHWENRLPQGNTLRGIWGSSSSDIYAVGDEGTIIHYDGISWSVLPVMSIWEYEGVWGASATDVYVFGLEKVLHFDEKGNRSYYTIERIGTRSMIEGEN